MYSISEQLLKDIKNPSRDIDIKVYIDNIELGKEEIENIEVEYSLGNNGVPVFGGVASTMITINLLKVGKTPKIFNAKKIEPYVGIYESSGNLVWIPLGLFYPKKKDIKNTKSGIEIVAFDKISDIDNNKYYSNLFELVDVKEVVKEIAEHLDVKINNLNDLPDLNYRVTNNKSARVILSEIAQLTGFNCFINRYGELEFKRYKEVDFELDGENVISFTLQSDEVINISKLIAKDSSNKQLEYGDNTGYCIELTTKKATKSNLMYIYEKIVKSYLPYEMECQGMPHLEVGDIVKFINVDGEEFNILIAEHKLRITGGLISEFSCEAINEEGYTLGTLNDDYSEKFYGDIDEKINKFKEVKYTLEFGTLNYNSDESQISISFYFTQSYLQEPVFMFQAKNENLKIEINPIKNNNGYFGGVAIIKNTTGEFIKNIIPVTAYCALPNGG